MQIAVVARITMKLTDGPDRVLIQSRPKGTARRRSFVTVLLCERFHFLEKFARYAVGAALAFMQSYEWLEPIPQAPLGLLVRETRKPTKVAPIGAGRIASEATGQFLSSLGAKRVIGEHSSVVDPYLEVAGRSLYDNSRLKTRLSHRNDRVSADIIDQAERMSAVWSDEDCAQPVHSPV